MYRDGQPSGDELAVFTPQGDTRSQPSPVPTIPPNPSDGTRAFDALDLFLMHYYSTRTSIRLFPAPEAQRIWQMVLPIEAQSHSLLQHGILAMAAMDLACSADLPPGVSVVTCHARGIHHQQIGLTLFQAMLQRDEPNTLHVMFKFSVMLLVLVFASVHSSNTSPSLDEILDLFALFRGTRTLWELCLKSPSTGLIETLFPESTPEESNLSELPAKDLFESLNLEQLDGPCSETVAILNRSWEGCHVRPLDVRLVGLFPATAPPAFWEQVRKREPAALQILAYYTVVLRPFSNRWWIANWDKILLSAIEHVWYELDTRDSDWYPSLLLESARLTSPHW